MSINHQDWDPVVLKKPTKPHHPPQISHEHKIMQQLESEKIVKRDLITPEKSKELCKLRNQKKITQKDLAKALNIKVDAIIDIERGTHIKNNALFAKIFKYLNQIPDPPIDNK